MTHKNLNKFNFTVIAGDITESDYMRFYERWHSYYIAANNQDGTKSNPS